MLNQVILPVVRTFFECTVPADCGYAGVIAAPRDPDKEDAVPRKDVLEWCQHALIHFEYGAPQWENEPEISRMKVLIAFKENTDYIAFKLKWM